MPDVPSNVRIFQGLLPRAAYTQSLIPDLGKQNAFVKAKTSSTSDGRDRGGLKQKKVVPQLDPGSLEGEASISNIF